MDHALSHRLGQRPEASSAGVLCVDTEADKPENAFDGELCWVIATATAYVYSGDAWVPLGGGSSTLMFHNDTFTDVGTELHLTYVPVDNSEHVYWNGLYQSSTQWTRTGWTVTLNGAGLGASDTIHVEYAYVDDTLEPFTYHTFLPQWVQPEWGAMDSAISILEGTSPSAWYDGSDSTYVVMRKGAVGTAGWAECGLQQRALPTMPANAVCEFHVRVRSTDPTVGLYFSLQTVETTRFSVHFQNLTNTPTSYVLPVTTHTAEQVASFFRNYSPTMEVRPSNATDGDEYAVYEFKVVFKVPR